MGEGWVPPQRRGDAEENAENTKLTFEAREAPIVQRSFVGVQILDLEGDFCSFDIYPGPAEKPAVFVFCGEAEVASGAGDGVPGDSVEFHVDQLMNVAGDPAADVVAFRDLEQRRVRDPRG